MREKSLQETFAPTLSCFGCGPANELGLRIRSIPVGDELIATWRPSSHHQAYPGMLNGGIIGTLLDCHCNWAAAHHLMTRSGLDKPPCTVTAEYTIKLRRPTPSDAMLTLRARIAHSEGDRVTVSGFLEAEGATCATCEGLFVAVREGHPAYHRW